MGQITSFPIPSVKNSPPSVEEVLKDPIVPEGVGTFRATTTQKPLHTSAGWVSPYQRQDRRVGGGEIASKNEKPKLREFNTGTIDNLKEMGFTREQILAVLESIKKQILEDNPGVQIKEEATIATEPVIVEKASEQPTTKEKKTSVLRPSYRKTFRKYAGQKLSEEYPQTVTETPPAIEATTLVRLPTEDSQTPTISEEGKDIETPSVLETASLTAADIQIPTRPEEAVRQEEVILPENVAASPEQHNEIEKVPGQSSQEKTKEVEALLATFNFEEDKNGLNYMRALKVEGSKASPSTLSWKHSLADIPGSFIGEVRSDTSPLASNNTIIYGMEQNNPVFSFLAYLGAIDQAADSVEIIKKYRGNGFSSYQEYLSQKSTLTISQYYQEVRKRFLDAEQKENSIMSPDLTLLYERTINDFGLQGLEEEDRAGILSGIAKTVQKQFLLDLYDIYGREKFDALLAAKRMGDAFYATTLKHLYPSYEEIFETSRMKVVSGFNKEEQQS